MTAIIISSIKLATDTYLPSTGVAAEVSSDIDTFFTFFFTTEALLKAITFGFIMDDGSYLRDSWSQLDFFIVISALFDFTFSGTGLSAVKILRLLRTLRPLRFISHNKGMKLVVTALMESVSGILNVLFVVFLVWYIKRKIPPFKFIKKFLIFNEFYL